MSAFSDAVKETLRSLDPRPRAPAEPKPRTIEEIIALIQSDQHVSEEEFARYNEHLAASRPGAAQAGVEVAAVTTLPHDPVNHPAHYTAHPTGIECIDITEHFSFNLGNAIKYIWRADLKNGTEDLRKAQWYLAREIAKREAK